MEEEEGIRRLIQITKTRQRSVRPTLYDHLLPRHEIV